MPEKLKPIKINNLGIYGLIRRAEVHDTLIPDGAVVEAVNVNFDRKGAIQSRFGLESFGETIVTSGGNRICMGLFNVTFSSSGLKIPLFVLARGGSQSIYMYSSGSWSVTLDGDTDNKRTQFLIFNDNLIRVNGADNMKVWTGGGTWITSGGQINPDDMASYDTKYLEAHKSRVYTAGDSNYPNRLYFSSVISSTGLIDWTPTTDWVDINPSDGESITALKRYSLELLVFKPNYIYRFKTSGVDPDPLIKIGTRSQNSIIEGKRGLYFYHPETGFYRYSGGMPEEISKPISDFIKNIPYSGFTDVPSWKDSDHIYWYIGDLTIDDFSFTRLVLRYTESSDLWTIYSFPNNSLAAATNYDDGYYVRNLLANYSNGEVYVFDDEHDLGVYSDNNNPIPYYFITKWYDFGSIEDRKLIKRMVGMCEKAQGSKLSYQIDDQDFWTELGQLTKYMTDFNQLSIKFHRIRFKLRGISNQEPFIFEGLAITDYENEGIII